jgi:nitrite reductase/ring-hydroxylating ferredoxin subunit
VPDTNLQEKDRGLEGFERVAKVSDIREGGLLGVTTKAGIAICLFSRDGEVGAMRDLCTHQAFPMSEGTLEPDGTVQCCWHGAKFDCESGEVRQGPAVERIRIFDVRVVDGAVWIKG